MKKLSFFILIALMANTVVAQKHYFTSSKPLGKPVLSEKQTGPEGSMNQVPPVIGEKPNTVTQIGNTWFDTQTYNSGNVMNRIYEYPDGNIGATWIDKGENGVPDRGTGYNFFDGANWTGTIEHLGGDPNNAFPSYAPWGATGEIVEHYQYILNDGPLKLLRRDIKGTGTWQEIVLPPPAGNYSIVWASMITSGTNHEYVHILAFTYDSPYMGQTNALLYYRSPDGGATWDINGEIIPGLDSAYFPAISSLKYSWAQPVGNTLAFTYGFDQFDGLVFKSTDNGTTWQKTVVYQSPFNPKNVPDQTPVYGSGDGSSAITLDSQGKVHVVFSRQLWFHDVITNPPGGWYYYPLNAEGMIYWNESLPALDSTIVSSYTLDYLAAGGYLIGWVFPPDSNLVIPSGQPNYGAGLTSGAQIGIDASDNLFVVWAALAPGYTDGNFFYRHLFGNSSPDGGLTWNGIKDLNTDIQFAFSECVYPAVAPIVGQKIQVVFQEDDVPGTGSGNENFMDHMDIDKGFFVGVPEVSPLPGFSVSQNYPNPAYGSTQFLVRLDQSSDVLVTMTNLPGEVVKRSDPGRLNPGNTLLTLDLSGLPAGIYFYTVSANGRQVTHKMVVRT